MVQPLGNRRTPPEPPGRCPRTDCSSNREFEAVPLEWLSWGQVESRSLDLAGQTARISSSFKVFARRVPPGCFRIECVPALW